MKQNIPSAKSQKKKKPSGGAVKLYGDKSPPPVSFTHHHTCVLTRNADVILKRTFTKNA